jgi:hypothetical protein
MWNMGTLRRLAGMTLRQLLVSPSTSMASGCSRNSTASILAMMVANGFAAPVLPTAAVQKMVGLAHAQVVKKNLVQLVVVVLAGVHQHVVAMLVQAASTRDRRMISGRVPTTDMILSFFIA